MAKGKQSKSKGYISKGLVGVDTKTLKQVKKDRPLYFTDMEKRKAYLKGKNVVLTIPNPDNNNTKERFVRVPAKDVWPHFKSVGYKMKGA